MVYKVYRIFNETQSYFMVSKVKMNMCLNLLQCYYNKYTEKENKQPDDYKTYFKIFDNTDNYDIEEVGSYENRTLAKQALLKFIEDTTSCINIKKEKTITKDEKIERTVKPVVKTGGKINKTSNISEYNKQKYKENREHFKQYYTENKDKIREYQKQRYQTLKSKLRELDELKNVKN